MLDRSRTFEWEMVSFNHLDDTHNAKIRNNVDDIQRWVCLPYWFDIHSISYSIRYLYIILVCSLPIYIYDIHNMSFHLISLLSKTWCIFGTKKDTFQKRNHQEIFGDPLFPTASFDPGLNLEPLRECYVLVENCNDEVEDVTKRFSFDDVPFCLVGSGGCELKKVGGNIGIIYIHLP